MSFPEDSDRWQDAVYWRASGFDDSGRPTVTLPIQIKVRWQWKYGEARDALGNVIALNAYVVLSCRVKVGSILWLGCLADFSEEALNSNDPDVEELCQVVTYNETPDIMNVAVRRTAGLASYRDSLPVIVV